MNFQAPKSIGNFSVVVLLVAAMLVLMACASAPKRDLQLEKLQSDIRSANSDAQIQRFAPSELARAQRAVRSLQDMRSNDPEVRAHLAYTAERRIDIARERASERFEQDRLIGLERERDKILLNASLLEAQRARAEAEELRRQNIARIEETQRANEDAAAALARSEEVAQQADLARKEAEQAKRLAEAEAEEADLARQEAELSAAQASSLRRQLENLQARETARGLVFTLGDVLFEISQDQLREESLGNLDRLVSFLKEYPSRKVNIEGHTDSRGSETFNQELSQKRADSVRRALIDRGIPGAQLQSVGLGEGFPIASNESEFGRQQNRRVEIIILNEDV